MDTVTWQALTAVLTLIGLAGTVYFWRRRGPVAGLRMLAVALLPAAAYLTGTLRLLWQIGDAVVTWATRLVLSPSVWVGVALAGLSVLLLVTTGVLRRRGGSGPERAVSRRPSRRSVEQASGSRTAPTRSPEAAPEDDDMADIEAILKRHGIS
jgi:hypothetical protein